MADMALMPVASVKDLEEQARRNSEQVQQQTYIQGLAAHTRSRWETAKDGKSNLEERMFQCVRQRNGEYDPDVLASIKQQSGSEIFIQLTSVKCRAATSWLRDTLLGSGADKPWAIGATPVPELPEDIKQTLQAELAQEIMAFQQSTGQEPDEAELA